MGQVSFLSPAFPLAWQMSRGRRLLTLGRGSLGLWQDSCNSKHPVGRHCWALCLWCQWPLCFSPSSFTGEGVCLKSVWKVQLLFGLQHCLCLLYCYCMCLYASCSPASQSFSICTRLHPYSFQVHDKRLFYDITGLIDSGRKPLTASFKAKTLNLRRFLICFKHSFIVSFCYTFGSLSLCIFFSKE